MNSRCFFFSVTGILVFFALLTHPASAQGPAASCACDTKAGTLVIRYNPGLGETKPALPKIPAPVHFMSLLELDKAQTTVEGTKSKSFTCQLKSDRFEITLEPGVPNPNLLGRCGGAVTGIVTVKRNGAVVLDEQEFEAMNCHERETFLSSVTFRDGSQKPILVYTKYEE